MIDFITQLPLLQAAPAGQGSIAPMFVTFGLVIVIFYFFIIRPQNKKQKETKAMLDAVKKGDKVSTIGGIRGTITSVKGETVVLKVDSDTTIEFTKSAIANVLDKKEEANTSEKADKGEKKNKEEK